MCECFPLAPDAALRPSEVEMRDMASITERAMVNLFHQGGTTSLAPASSMDRLGPKGSLLFLYFLNKIKLQVSPIPSESGSLSPLLLL